MNTFLFTWNPKRWSWSTLDSDVATYKADMHFDDRWSCGVTKTMRTGDRAFLIKVGPQQPTGIMASGYVLTPPYQEQHYSDPSKIAWYVDLRYEILLHPDKEEILPRAILQENIPNVQWSPRASGMTIRKDEAVLLESLWTAHICKLGLKESKQPFPMDGDATVNGLSTVSDHWTDAEYQATVEAYLWMLEQEQSGKPYNKSKVNKDLRDGPLAARSKPSVEFRMRNISAVLEELCLPWIKGYLPAGNVRGEGKEKVKFYLANAGGYTPDDYAPTADPDDFEEKVRKLRKKITATGIPTGQRNPKQTSTTASGFVRDPLVKAWVLENAEGTCEGCGDPAPFTSLAGEPFLEVHHLKLLSDLGTDTPTNAVAVCPNCHRRCHHSHDQTTFIDSIYLKVPRLIRE